MESRTARGGVRGQINGTVLLLSLPSSLPDSLIGTRVDDVWFQLAKNASSALKGRFRSQRIPTKVEEVHQPCNVGWRMQHPWHLCVASCFIIPKPMRKRPIPMTNPCVVGSSLEYELVDVCHHA
eukprot:scaffold64842_cov53-Attheya_sp.AAC.1